jgi:hypothetical protein
MAAKAIEVLEELKIMSMMDFGRPRGPFGKPGALVACLSEDKRQALSTLTAEELNKNFHPNWCLGRVVSVLEQEKLKFDRLLRKENDHVEVRKAGSG